MNTAPPAYSKLHYEHEVLWARYEIREHYLRTIVRDIYENIGQVLSLVRVQLSLLTPESETDRRSAEGSGELIGQVIRDLRHMCRSFYPETELLDKSGLLQALRYELMLLGLKEQQLLVRGMPQPLETGREMILFRMLQEVLLFIEVQGSKVSLQMMVVYGKAAVGFLLRYAGAPLANDPSSAATAPVAGLSRLTLQQRAELIGGSLHTEKKKTNESHIKLIVPFKTSVYE